MPDALAGISFICVLNTFVTCGDCKAMKLGAGMLRACLATGTCSEIQPNAVLFENDRFKTQLTGNETKNIGCVIWEYASG